ncbi:MAG: hypothetical protein CVT73_05700 [Alphaproteobacteria bacterium HGW-Alphaproteobacteria-12]|nr:MAG: hypothetical protein CVT73_05700 [Alphaproteobacteria bacterium HGW-Alphaproteobacteria-12]
MAKIFMRNAVPVDLSGFAPPTATTLVLRVTITPRYGGVFIYAGPDYDIPIPVNGPEWEGYVSCQPPKIYIQPVSDPAPQWSVECVGWEDGKYTGAIAPRGSAPVEQDAIIDPPTASGAA